ncbi:MAG: type IV pilus assembly protein PilQ [Methylophagaceae bacterium]|jgi:type IV pilus assembly protein PilQ
MTSDDGIMMNKRQVTYSWDYKKIKVIQYFLLMLLTLSFFSVSTHSMATALESVGYSSLPGEKAQIVLTFSDSIDEPSSFSIDDPARIVLDFAGVKNQLDKKTQPVNIGMTRSISTVEAGDRTRMVVNLVKKAPYTIEHHDNVVMVTVEGGIKYVSDPKTGSDREVVDIDFRRGEQGEGRLMIELSDAGTPVDVRQERDTIVIDLSSVSLPEELHRRLDVVDFATPVQIIETESKGDNTRLILSTEGQFEHLAYQSDRTLIVEVKALKKEEQVEVRKDQYGYKGEKLSLNFQNIEVRAVLQLLAEFTGLNLVTSDTVQGNVTLRLKNVPWDQAMDIILKTKGLAMRQNGNVMLIAPAAEIAAREKQELEAQKQLVELEPLYSEIIEINFAKAADIATILNTQLMGAGMAMGNADEGQGFLSRRGRVQVDERTNSLLLKDTAEKLAQINELIAKLDIPVRQVLIESRIVIANNDFTDELGVRFGVSSEGGNNAVSGTLNDISIAGNQVTTSQAIGGPVANSVATNQGLNVNLPVAAPAGSIGLALAKLPFGTILQLELSAMQAEGRGEIVSSPRVITSNQQTALIEQGTEIPFQEASSSGATAVSFKEAVLKLEVTPQITPDDRVVMDLKVNKDSVGVIFNGVPSIDTRSVETQVLVDNGETVVLGGVYEQTNLDNVEKVPFFGDLPYLGVLFRTTTVRDDKAELLIFVTPKIVKDSLDF